MRQSAFVLALAFVVAGCDMATVSNDAGTGCAHARDCASGTVCVGGLCARPTACTSSRACPGLVCDLGMQICVDCVSDSDCAAGMSCRSDVCEAPAPSCATDRDCSALMLVCAVTNHVCVECNHDADCAAGGSCGADHTCLSGLDASNGGDASANDAGTLDAGANDASAVDANPDAATSIACAVPGWWFADVDGDGFGDETTSIRSCSAVAGRVPLGGDCADDDPTRHEGATQRCDGLDDDCDGSIDEYCSCTGGMTRACGLGVGACIASTQMCGFGDNTWLPCNSTTVPTVESCNGIDDDCDGRTDESPGDQACGAGSMCSSGRCTTLHASRVFAGDRHAFALMTDGTLYEWGNGPLMPVSGVSSVRSFANSTDLTCAVTPDGRLLCEGQCYHLPTASTSCSSGYPTMFTDWGPFAAATVATGEFVGCFIDGAGALRCWAAGLPMPVTNVPSAVDVAVGSLSACAIAPGGSVQCWGRNDRGNLGNGSVGGSSTAGVSVAIDDATDIALGSMHACARRASGEIWCWGSDDFGELGDGGPVARSGTPVHAQGLPSDAILPSTLADASTCVIRASDGHVLCFGYGAEGSLGDGRGVTSTTPVEVTGLSGVVDLSGAGTYWCALTSAQQVSCWGHQTGGVMTLSPSPVIGLP